MVEFEGCPSNKEPQLDFLTLTLFSQLSEPDVTSELETMRRVEAWLLIESAMLNLRGIDPANEPFEDEWWLIRGILSLGSPNEIGARGPETALLDSDVLSPCIPEIDSFRLVSL